MSILDGTTGGGTAVEAHTIVASVMVGFLATRILLKQPVQISFEEEEELSADTAQIAAHATLVKKLDQALKARGYDSTPIGGLTVAYTPTYDTATTARTKHVGITGRTGGASLEFLDRHRTITGPVTVLQVEEILREFSDRSEYGAYYGVVDNPVAHERFNVSSVRRVITYRNESGRWESGEKFHGLIGGGDAAKKEKEKGSFKQGGSIEKTNLVKEWDGEGGVMGYCHGMTWAIQRCKELGPWTTPYEIAIGAKTKKLASCFACTTFMYATGYPPSAIHIGRADSWVPLPTTEVENPFLGEHTPVLNSLWAHDIAGYLQVGSAIVGTAIQFKEEARDIAKKLERAVRQRTSRGPMAIANLYLDALTIHEKDVTRLLSVLE